MGRMHLQITKETILYWPPKLTPFIDGRYTTQWDNNAERVDRRFNSVSYGVCGFDFKSVIFKCGAVITAHSQWYFVEVTGEGP